MKQRYRVFRRENGIYYSLDRLTKKRNSLNTADAKKPAVLSTLSTKPANSPRSICKSPRFICNTAIRITPTVTWQQASESF